MKKKYIKAVIENGGAWGLNPKFTDIMQIKETLRHGEGK